MFRQALQFINYDKPKAFGATLGVLVAIFLIGQQAGIFIFLTSLMTTLVDNSKADIWVANGGVSVDIFDINSLDSLTIGEPLEINGDRPYIKTITRGARGFGGTLMVATVSRVRMLGQVPSNKASAILLTVRDGFSADSVAAAINQALLIAAVGFALAAVLLVGFRKGIAGAGVIFEYGWMLWAGLKLEMHFPAGEELRLTDSLRLAMSDTLSLNTTDNYDILNYNLQLEESRNALDQLGHSRRPSVDAEGYLGAQFFSQSPDFYNFNRWYGLSYIGLTASLPIYDGQGRRYGAQIENLKMEQVRNQVQAYRIEQENKAIRASLQMESARAQAALARQAIETAGKNLEMARFNYQNELTGFQPVFDALQALADSRGQLANAKGAYVQALLDARLLDL